MSSPAGPNVMSQKPTTCFHCYGAGPGRHHAPVWTCPGATSLLCFHSCPSDTSLHSSLFMVSYLSLNKFQSPGFCPEGPRGLPLTTPPLTPLNPHTGIFTLCQQSEPAPASRPLHLLFFTGPLFPRLPTGQHQPPPSGPSRRSAASSGSLF